MVRRRWAAAVGLVACLLMLLHPLTPGLADEARSALPVTSAAGATEPGAAPGAGAEGAEEPCPCEEVPPGRQLAARTPRAAGASGMSPVVAGTAVPGGSGAHLRAAGTPPCPVAVGSAPSTARLQTFRC
ncbi:hypothetical protein GCM10010309_70790 [Streptomyces violaceochromogenes]|uniref:Secreted protein n=1 Tax=Streptomyces collinus TaxID=42684 RepID=A0AA89QAE0_STRCU|nr:hypothetical protein [Streptomyces collinus]GHC89588.1 hypothetical protein GCM10010309_70790 [Streptomyces violaceochromogenes]